MHAGGCMSGKRQAVNRRKKQIPKTEGRFQI